MMTRVAALIAARILNRNTLGYDRICLAANIAISVAVAVLAHASATRMDEARHRRFGIVPANTTGVYK